MHALRSRLINISDQVLVDILAHERDHGSSHLRYSHESCVKRHVGIDFVLLHSLGPEALTASSHVPVAHIIHKVLKGSRSLRDPVISKIAVHFLDQGV